MLALVHGAVLNHLLPLLNERELPSNFAVLIAAMIGPMQVTGRLAMVSLQHRFENRQFMLFAFAAIGGAVLLLLLASDTRAMIVGFVLIYGSAWGTISILRPVIACEILGQSNFGAKSGYLSLLFQGGLAFSAYLGALIWGIGGYPTMLAVMIALAGFGAVLYVFAQRIAVNQTGD